MTDWNKLGVMSSLVLVLIAVANDFLSPGSVLVQTLTGTVTILLISYAVWEYMRERLGLAELAMKKINKLERQYGFMAKFSELEKKMALLEARVGSNKGVIDPGHLIFMLIVLFFILYMRARGWI